MTTPYDYYGYETLSRTLRLVVLTWEGEKTSIGGCMLKGVAQLIDAYDTELKDDIFQEKLGNISAKSIMREAKERIGGVRGYAETMLIEYNKRNRAALPYEKLFERGRRRRTPSKINYNSGEGAPLGVISDPESKDVQYQNSQKEEKIEQIPQDE